MPIDNHTRFYGNYLQYRQSESGTSAGGLLSYEQWLEGCIAYDASIVKSLRRDLEAANARAAQAERERDALIKAARDVIAWDDKSSGNYKGAWEIVADADKLNALNALLYPAQPADEGGAV